MPSVGSSTNEILPLPVEANKTNLGDAGNFRTVACTDASHLCSKRIGKPMHRWTARVLLIFVAMAAFAPVLQAFSAEPPHACCLRRLRGRTDRGFQVQDAIAPAGNCCPPLTTPHSAQVITPNGASFQPHISALKVFLSHSPHGTGFESSQSTRAPPVVVLS